MKIKSHVSFFIFILGHEGEEDFDFASQNIQEKESVVVPDKVVYVYFNNDNWWHEQVTFGSS